MRIQSLIVGFVSALGLALAGAAFATDDSPKFEDVDSNKDGRLSKSEAQSVPNLDFASADKNQDGMLSRTEYIEAIS